MLIDGNSYGAAGVEADASLPLIPNRLSLGVGAGLYRNAFYNATDSQQHIEAVSLRITPSDRVEIIPFWARSDLYGDEAGPIYIPAGDFRPPRVPRRRYFGPAWARYRGVAINYGAFGSADLGDGWNVRAGLFRSLFDDARSFTNLIFDLTPQGTGRQLIIADPPSKLASTSGELRLAAADQRGIDVHLGHVVDDDRHAQPFDICKNMVEQGRLAGAEKSRQHRDGQFADRGGERHREPFLGLSCNVISL